jgi:hypothetical protein
VELLIALALTAFLATSLLSIISMGGKAFQRVLDEKNARSEVRIALSYITVKIRQNGVAGGISVIPSDSATNSKNVLMIRENPDRIADESYYIYFEDAQDGGAGRLVEKRSARPYVDDPANAFKIAEISDFDIAYANDEQTVINISVSRDTPYERVTGDVSVALRMTIY